jgi:thiazole synthase
MDERTRNDTTDVSLVQAPCAQQASPDQLVIYGELLASRLMLGTALYPSPAVLEAALKASGAGVLTVSLRREQARGQTGARFMALISDMVRDQGVKILPNTAGCRTAKDAIVTAQMARELFATDWIKLEVIANDDTLQPDVFGLVEAAEVLCRDGFKVLPYTTDDLSVAERLLRAGCQVLMPWGSPIGSGRGLNNIYGLRTLRAYAKGVVLVVDAGLGAPSHAAAAMELGYDACLLNTAVAKAVDPALMGQAFMQAIDAGRSAYRAGLMEPRDMASPSTPLAGTPFFELDQGP